MSTLICALCKTEFAPVRDGTWSEEMAKAEYHRLFPDSKWENREVICDDCWEVVKPSRPVYYNQ